MNIDKSIFRAELVQKMKTMSAKTNIFITAPGGYGKTVAAGQWVSVMRKKAEFIIVTDADNDPGVFYRKLARALLILAGKTNSLPQSNMSFDRLLETARSLPTRHSRVYLIIDDLHILRNEEIINSLRMTLNRFPAYICLCLISRSEPSKTLLETGKFEIIRQRDLLFTSKELKPLIEEESLTTEEISGLLKTTGGWAIYLSLLLTDKEYDETHQTLTEYLDKQVWELWGNDTRTVLLRLAVPHEVTPELAGRLTGQTDGDALLTRLVMVDNAFLSYIREDVYRFHDIFRDFLMERLEKYLSEEEIRRLNDVTAEWHYEHGDYFNSIRYFFNNRDHGGIVLCERAINTYNEETEDASVEASYHFNSQTIMYMPASFVAENPFLLASCCSAAYWDGDMPDFMHWLDILQGKLPEIAPKYPDLMETVAMLGAIDPRTSVIGYARRLAAMMGAAKTESGHTNTVTQNLPLFHRSVRDLSENYELKPEDLELYGNTFGLLVGKDWNIMEQSLIAGIYYERGELIKAAYHAMIGIYACEEGTHSEAWFTAHMILSVILYAMGASQEADSIMDQSEVYIERKARFLRPNFKALQTICRRDADTGVEQSAAREWLEIYAPHTEQLPFYQIVRHFATLRCHMALGDYESAAIFGKRLQALGVEYARPIDRIESGLLTAIALWNSGEKEDATAELEQAALIAMPYGFTQLFINEGDKLLPIFWALKDKSGQSADIMNWIDKLIDGIYKKHGAVKGKLPDLTAQQRAMLPYLSKGMSYREIADATGIGYDTVKSHVRLLYRRLGVHNAGEAVIKAKMLGLMG